MLPPIINNSIKEFYYNKNSSIRTCEPGRTDRSGQTVQTQIRLLLEEQSDQGIHCLLFQLHQFDKIPFKLAYLFELYAPVIRSSGPLGAAE